MNDLALSARYRVYNEYEVVVLLHPEGRLTVIGDFYGDPVCAVISPGEAWCAMGGAGLIIYFLKEPFEPYQYNHTTDQWVEFGREKGDIWWIESLTAVSETRLVFMTDPSSPQAGTYHFDVVKGHIHKNV